VRLPVKSFWFSQNSVCLCTDMMYNFSL